MLAHLLNMLASSGQRILLFKVGDAEGMGERKIMIIIYNHFENRFN
jgi:hypothetical protein